MLEYVKDNIWLQLQYFGSPKFQRPRLSHRWSPPSRTSVRKGTLFSCQPENIKSSRTIANPQNRSFQFCNCNCNCLFLTCIMSRNSSSVKEREFVSSNVDRAYAFTNILWHHFKNEDADNIVVDGSAYVDYYLMSRLFEDIKGRGANIDDERLQLRVA